MTQRAPCPQCRRPAVLGPDNPWRPFCSERCKLIDLGEWVEGERRIPGDEPAPPADDEDAEIH